MDQLLGSSDGEFDIEDDTTDTDSNNRLIDRPSSTTSDTTDLSARIDGLLNNDTDEDRSHSPIPDPSPSFNHSNTTNNSSTTITLNQSAPIPVDLSQNFELSLSTNEQLYHLLKESHLENERLTARVHELERNNKSLVAAAQQAAIASSQQVDTTPGSSYNASSSNSTTRNNTNGSTSTSSNSNGVALSTLVAERDAALSEMEVLSTRVRDAEKNADNMVDAMRRANDSLSADMRTAKDSLAEKEMLVSAIQLLLNERNTTVQEGRLELESSRIEMNSMKNVVENAEEIARKASIRAQRLESQSLDLKRRLNQLAQDLVASEQDLKVTAQNKIHLEQNVVHLRVDIKRLRAIVQTARTTTEREQLARTEAEERLAVERRTRRREHESSSRRVLQLERLRSVHLTGNGSSKQNLLTSGGTTSQRSAMEVELLKAQREESKLKDASLVELASQIKQLRNSRTDLTARLDMVSYKCNDLEQLNRVLLTENQVCLSLLSAARVQSEDRNKAATM
tara:strand:+ start:95 stop:1624 length:1530 start_codon:yes stop_codon:yes gene_type:complete